MAYSLVCLFFSVHVSYPFIHWPGWDLGGISYLIEDVSYFAMLSCMVLPTIRLCSGILPIKLHMSVYTFTALMAVSPVIFTYALFPGFPSVVNVYGTIVYTSKLMVSLYLILLAFLGAVKEKSSVWLLAGNAVFGFGLFTDLWTGGAYEPLCFGWQDEYSGFLMVLFFMVLIIRYNRGLIVKNQQLTQQLQEEVEAKTARLSKMLEERKEFLSIAAHDLKAPVSAIKTYIDFIREGGIHEPPCPMDCNEFLSYVYTETKPYTDAGGIYYYLHLPEGSLTITAEYSDKEAVITFTDTGEGISPEDMPHITPGAWAYILFGFLWRNMAAP